MVFTCIMTFSRRPYMAFRENNGGIIGGSNVLTSDMDGNTLTIIPGVPHRVTPDGAWDTLPDNPNRVHYEQLLASVTPLSSLALDSSRLMKPDENYPEWIYKINRVNKGGDREKEFRYQLQKGVSGSKAMGDPRPDGPNKSVREGVFQVIVPNRGTSPV